MATVTVNLGGYSNTQTSFIQWGENIGLGSTFSLDGGGQALDFLRLFNSGGAQISLIGSNNRFTTEFESTGRIIVTASDGETLEVMIANADMTEPYVWTPANSAEVMAFANHVRGLTNHDATLTLTDEDPTITVDLSVFSNQAAEIWFGSAPYEDIGSELSLDGATTMYFGRVALGHSGGGVPGRVILRFSASADESPITAGPELSNDVEAGIVITFTASDGESVVVTGIY